MPVVSPELSAKYELVSPSGFRAVFNDATDPDYVGPLTEHSGFDSAEIREESENRPGTDGGLHGRFLFGRRPMTMTGRILNPASQDERAVRIEKAERAVLDCLKADGVLSWTLASGQALFCRVRVQQPLRIEGAWQKTFQIAMVAADPLLYAVNESVAGVAYAEPSIPIFVNTGDTYAYTRAPVGPPGPYDANALPFPWTFPLNWAALPSVANTYLSHQVTATNTGSAPTWPVLRVSKLGNETFTNVVLTNATTGVSFTLNGGFGPDDELLIDMKDKSVTINGADGYSRVNTLSSDWWQLAPGDNIVNLTVSGGSGSPLAYSRLQVAWRDAWR